MSTGIGEALREAREQQGRELHDAARVLRVRSEQLRALEEERFDSFGGDIYAKGFLRSYATELGLDPEPLLDVYRREVSDQEVAPTAIASSGAATPPTTRSGPPPWLAWVLVAVVVLAGLAVLGFLGGDRTPGTASPPDGVEEAPPSSAGEEEPDEGDGEQAGDQSDDEAAGDDEASDEAAADDAAAADDQDEPAAVEGVELVLAFEEDSWLRVVIDGTPVLEETATSGETRQFEGEERVEVRFGNAGGVRVEHNGEDLGTVGARGQPRTITFTEDDAEPEDGGEL